MAAVTEDDSQETINGKSIISDKITAVIFVGILVVVGAVAGYDIGTRLQSERGDKAAREVERQTAERELRHYAETNELPLTNIRVTREDGKLMASWQQGNQTCSVEAVKPSEQNKLWSTNPIEEGTGQCLTKSGSAGINGGG